MKPATLRLCRVCTVPKISSRWHNQYPFHGAPIVRTEILDIPCQQMGCPRFNRCEEDRLIFGGKMDVDGQWPGAGMGHKLQPLGELGQCVFRSKIATDSGRTLPPIPAEGCH
jgi:hypothetical protein